MYHLKQLFAYNRCCDQIRGFILKLLSGSRIALYLLHEKGLLTHSTMRIACVSCSPSEQPSLITRLKNSRKVALHLSICLPLCIIVLCFAQLGCGGGSAGTTTSGWQQHWGGGSQNYSISGTISLADGRCLQE